MNNSTPNYRHLGFIGRAKEFYTAFQADQNTNNANKDQIRFVSYYLLGHAIELALKAYLLRSHGYTEKRLRSLSHDLDKALDEATSIKAQLNEAEIAQINLLNEYYKNKDFEYSNPGYKELPTIDELGQTTAHLIEIVEGSF